MANMEPHFETIFKEQDFEIRDYHASVAADVTLAGRRVQTARRAMSLLRHYLAGGNELKRRLTVIPPVLQVRSQGITNGAIAPVVQSDDFGLWTLRLTLSNVGQLGSLPLPDDRRVCLSAQPPSRVAALRFSGLGQVPDIKAKTSIVTWMALACRELAIGPIWVARYSSAWTPWFLRRNELLLPLRSAAPMQTARISNSSPVADWVLVPCPSGLPTYQERLSS
ncbi:SOUL family heme-binding protein [Oryzibacter oryziterrae]|uniref:SOUL family heme-binding protein n=1 Tax=Oryzibacter oryziterrae TaxID=2766474 RepID=UPI001F2C862E|nr:heme-binding protein [Oryzibacter oryziterrae]